MILSMAKRKNNNAVSISDEAKALLDSFRAQSKMPYVSIIEETLRWLADQSDVVRCVVWGTLPPSAAPEIARLELERMTATEGDRQAEVAELSKELRDDAAPALDKSAASVDKARSKPAHPRRQGRGA